MISICICTAFIGFVIFSVVPITFIIILASSFSHVAKF